MDTQLYQLLKSKKYVKLEVNGLSMSGYPNNGSHYSVSNRDMNIKICHVPESLQLVYCEYPWNFVWKSIYQQKNIVRRTSPSKGAVHHHIKILKRRHIQRIWFVPHELTPQAQRQVHIWRQLFSNTMNGRFIKIIDTFDEKCAHLHNSDNQK